MQFRISINEFRVVFENVNLPVDPDFGQVKIIAAYEGATILPGRVGQIMESNSIAEHFRLIGLQRNIVVSCLVMDGFQTLKSLGPGIRYLLRRQFVGLTAHHRGHIQHDFICETGFDALPVAVVGADKQAVDRRHYVFFFNQAILWVSSAVTLASLV